MTLLNLSDVETCYRAFRREVIQQVAPVLREKRFGIEPELTARLAKIPDVRIFEVPLGSPWSIKMGVGYSFFSGEAAGVD